MDLKAQWDQMERKEKKDMLDQQVLQAHKAKEVMQAQ